MERRLEPYTSELVLQKLREDLIGRAEDRLNPSNRMHFWDKLLSSDRKPISLKPEAKIYDGPWYSQGDEPTCAAWAVAHGALVVGAKPNPDLLTNLLNQATGYTNPSRIGLNPTHILTEVRKHDTEFDINKPEGQEQLMQCVSHKIRLEYNADFIKQCLDRSRAILVAVRVPDYGGNQNINHKICIAGYRVTDQGFMNLHIIDSNWGVLWTSLEHISSAIVDRTTLVVSKKS